LFDAEREATLLTSLRCGNRAAVGDLFELHRERLLRVVHVRLSPRLRQRVDTADVVQETYLVASKRIDEFLSQQEGSLFVWLRFLAVQKVVDLHREHLRAMKRSMAREVGAEHTSSAQILANLIATTSTPCAKAMRGELRDRLTQVIQEIPESDRNILLLRHFEQLTNQEVAETLKMNQSSVSTRHVRALVKLKSLLIQHDEFRDLLSQDFE
jgi:RNA polymerase sigma-70 factor (ECF subfamily)